MSDGARCLTSASSIRTELRGGRRNLTVTFKIFDHNFYEVDVKAVSVHGAGAGRERAVGGILSARLIGLMLPR